MDKILIAIVVLLAAGYLFHKYYLIFTKKETVCGCGYCSAKTGEGNCSCRSLAVNNGMEQIPDDKE